ncbi:MAG: hypothetical protein ACLQFM_06280 [Terriglobales bacterium]
MKADKDNAVLTMITLDVISTLPIKCQGRESTVGEIVFSMRVLLNAMDTIITGLRDLKNPSYDRIANYLVELLREQLEEFDPEDPKKGELNAPDNT